MKEMIEKIPMPNFWRAPVDNDNGSMAPALWNEGDTTAKHISDVLKKEIGWNMNTTYTLIKRCIKKGAIERSEPNFMCHALIPKEEVQEAETKELVDKIYDGSVDKLFAALLGRKKLSAEQIQKLKQIVEDLE